MAAKENYVETKENSDWRVETKKAEVQQDRQFLLEERHLTNRTASEHKEREAEREKQEQQEAWLAQQEQEMQRKMAQAKAERDLALQNLEHLRNAHSAPLPVRTQHHPARPRNRAEQV